jgi:hypothetical protein
MVLRFTLFITLLILGLPNEAKQRSVAPLSFWRTLSWFRPHATHLETAGMCNGQKASAHQRGKAREQLLRRAETSAKITNLNVFQRFPTKFQSRLTTKLLTTKFQ